MTVALERVNNVPLYDKDESNTDMGRWLLTVVDSLNTTIGEIETTLNANVVVKSFTQVEITNMAASLVDGVLLYDTTNNVYVGRENGALRQFTTSSWP